MKKTLGASGSKNATRLQKLVDEKFEQLMLDRVGPRLDRVEEYCKERLTAVDKRNKDIQSFILGEVKVNVGDQLYNADMTVKAIEKSLIQMFADAGLNFDADKFSKLIDQNKMEISEQTKKDAAEKLQQRIDDLIAKGKEEDAAKLKSVVDQVSAAEAASAKSEVVPQPEAAAQS